MLTFSKLRAWGNPAGVLLILATVFIAAALAKAGGSQAASECVQEQTAAAGCCKSDGSAASAAQAVSRPTATEKHVAAACDTLGDGRAKAKDATFVVATDLKLTTERQDSSCGECKSSGKCASATSTVECDNECAEFIAPIVNLWAARKGVAVDSPEARAFARDLVTIHANQAEDRTRPLSTSNRENLYRYENPYARADAPMYDGANAARCIVAPSVPLAMCQPCADLSIPALDPPAELSSVDQLRAASAEMDETAMNLERSGLYEAADRVRASAQSLRIDARRLDAAEKEPNKQRPTSTKQAACEAASCGECCADGDGCCKDSATVVASDCFQEMIAEWTRMFDGNLKIESPPAKCKTEPRTAKAVEGFRVKIGMPY